MNKSKVFLWIVEGSKQLPHIFETELHPSLLGRKEPVDGGIVSNLQPDLRQTTKPASIINFEGLVIDADSGNGIDRQSPQSARRYGFNVIFVGRTVSDT